MRESHDERREREAFPPLVRSAWLSRRARNATRQAGRVATLGGVLFVATFILLLVLRSSSAGPRAPAGQPARGGEGSNWPPLALFLTALCVAVGGGYVATLALEMRNPRIADAEEASHNSALAILSVTRSEARPPERMRRSTDADTPPYLNTFSEAFRLAYLRVAEQLPLATVVAVTGDSAAVSAVIGANIAAAAASDARSTLLADVDLEAGAASAVLGIASQAGVADVLAGRLDWSSVIIAAPIGRERTLDVLPAGFGGTPPGDARESRVRGAHRADLARVARRYDVVVFVASAGELLRGDDALVPTRDVVVCARIGTTHVAYLRDTCAALRAAGARLHGCILWDDEEPDVRMGARRDDSGASARARIRLQR